MPLKYFSKFLTNFKISIINCENNLLLTFSANSVISEDTFAIKDTKLYVLVVTLSTQDNTKLLQQFKLGFKRTTDRYRFQIRVTKGNQN